MVSVDVGVRHPDVYAALYGTRRRESPSEAERRIEDVLGVSIRRIAEAGRLAVTRARAVQLAHVVGRGTVLTLIGNGPVLPDDGLVDDALTMLLGAMVTDDPGGGDQAGRPPWARAATTVHASLARVPRLTEGEKALLGEWLTRIEGAAAIGREVRETPRDV